MIRSISLLGLIAILFSLGSCLNDHLDPDQPAGWRTLAELPASPPFFLVNMKDNLYAGTGNGTFPVLLTKLWQYDFGTNSWKPKKDFPGKLESGLSYFIVNEKLYVGLSTTGELNPSSSFDLEAYSTDIFEYDPVTDEWKTVVLPSPRSGTGATSFNYQNKGVTLWGTYRTPANTFVRWNQDGLIYDSSTGWGKVNLTIYDTPTFPAIADNIIQQQLITYRVLRKKGFGFVINNRVYTGGGSVQRSGTFDPFYGYDELQIEVESHDLYEFERTETPDGINLVISNNFKTPTSDYNLTGAHQAFPLNNTGYIITNDGKLISYTPSTNQWQKFDALSSPLVVGTSLAEKAYFINQNSKLLEFTPH